MKKHGRPVSQFGRSDDDCTVKTQQRPPPSLRPRSPPLVSRTPAPVSALLVTPTQTPPQDDLTGDSPIQLVVGLGGVVLAALVAALLQTSIWVCVMVVVVAAIACGGWLHRRSAQRIDRVRTSLESYRQQIDQWQHRWMKLQMDAQQTTSALQKMRDGVILLSHSGNILIINPSARRLLAVDEDSVVEGRRLAEVVRIPEVSRGITAAAAGDGTQTFQLEIASGESLRSIQVRVDPIASHVETKLMLTLHDQTETNRVDEIRREFVANISHELKTPLAAIKGYAETVELAIQDDPDAAQHFMSQIRSQCLRLERLIADMMQLARAQAGRTHLTIARVDVREVLAESMKSYRPVAEAKDIQLHYSEDAANETRTSVMSDREATLTIANNLIGNAIRYTSAGGNVHVGFREAGRFLALVVEDDGVGIPANEQKRVFERFYRVQKSRVSREDEAGGMTVGTGIGLSIVKNLTIALGGEVRLTSNPGEGARFEVLLPLATLDHQRLYPVEPECSKISDGRFGIERCELDKN